MRAILAVLRDGSAHEGSLLQRFDRSRKPSLRSHLQPLVIAARPAAKELQPFLVELRATARQRLTITLAKPAGHLDLSEVAGVLETDVKGTTLHALVEGSLQPVLDALRRYEVVRVTSHDDDLDDLFLGFYR